MSQDSGPDTGDKDKPASTTDRVNILLVDDLPEKLLAYQLILQELDQNIMLAHSGEEALKLVLKHEFAVILLDVNMPGMDGFETAAMIRGRKKSSRTPIIFLTAFTDDFHAAQSYASGGVDYLPTPVVPEILKAKVRVFIELSQMRQQAASQAEEKAKRAAAEDADRRKDEFLGMLAHELRNPLGPISNAIHLLRMIGAKEPRQEQLHDIIERQVVHMGRLIDDLLDSTRLARGQILLRKEWCDLTKIVYQSAEDYRNIFDASGIALDIEVPKDHVWIEGDPTRLAQTVGNLLHNAHKFTDPGGLITVTLKHSARKATITVRDTGVGIEPDVLPHIFEVFRQAEQGLDRNRGGLGLGLSLVKGLTDLHNGKVYATSEGAGKGSEFTIELPIKSASFVAAPVEDIAPVDMKSKCRILVIEDNKDTAESVRMLLTHEGYEVETAYTGSGGLETARRFQPQIILCDIGLPGMDGYQVARTIRQDNALSSTCIIALTGYGRDEDQRQAREAGFDMHLTKPIDYNNLRRALSQFRMRA
ncbi:MAG: response regulator [Micavibrio sp.]